MFTVDLCAVVTQWLSDGHHVVIGIDLNECTRSSLFRRQLEKLGLVDIHIQRHGTTPPTYQRGTRTIDAVYVSRSLIHAKCGYLPFGDALTSDHRALWCDIPVPIAFGYEPPLSSVPQMRRLRCHDPRNVQQYNRHLSAALISADLPSRVSRLCNEISFPPTEQHCREWDSIDQARVQPMNDADRQCRKLRVGAVPWSPVLQVAIDAVTYWSLKLKSIQGGRVSSRLLIRLQKRAQILIKTNDLGTVKANRLSAIQHYRDLKKSAESLRNTWLEDLAEARAQAGGGFTAQQFSALRLTSVWAPNSSGQWIEHCHRSEIEAACIQENSQRFQQAGDTPFLQAPLKDLIDFAATGLLAQAVKQGTFQAPERIDKHTARFL